MTMGSHIVVLRSTGYISLALKRPGPTLGHLEGSIPYFLVRVSPCGYSSYYRLQLITVTTVAVLPKDRLLLALRIEACQKYHSQIGEAPTRTPTAMIKHTIWVQHRALRPVSQTVEMYDRNGPDRHLVLKQPRIRCSVLKIVAAAYRLIQYSTREFPKIKGP